MPDIIDERPAPGGPADIKPVSILDEMKRSYLDYAMSVIVSRALPDVRDGLKPVHRRILYAMRELNFTPDRPYNKSARTVGDVIGKYHPHGELAVYDALVRMAQDFSMSAPLIDGQGNFGSVDGDPPAAQRYTEARLAPVSMALLDDLDKDTVDFKPNYDEKETSRSSCLRAFPICSSTAQAASRSAWRPTSRRTISARRSTPFSLLMDKPDITLDELLEHIPGPDFPTGGSILGRAGIRAAYATGRGSIIMRAKVAVEELRKDREALIVSEIPYQVNKATLIERIAELVREKRVEGISDLRDESDRDGMRIVIEIKRDAVADVVLNQLWRFTALQSSFGANMIALNGGRPEMLTLTDMLRAFLDFREEVVTRRTKYLLTKARDNAHIQVGLAIAVANIDEVIRLIRTSPEFGDRANRVDGADVAGARHGAAHHAHRRSAPRARRRWRDPSLGSAGARDPRIAPRAPDRARTRRDRRGPQPALDGNRRLSRHPELARAADEHHPRRARQGEDRLRHAAPHRSSSTATPTWRTRTSSSARTWSCW